MNSSEVVGTLDSSLTAVQFSKGYGGRHANERLPMRQIVLPTEIVGSSEVHFRGALYTQREDHDGMTILTMLFSDEAAAMKMENELLSLAMWVKEGKQ